MTTSSLYRSIILNGISKDDTILHNSVKKCYNILLTYNLFAAVLIFLHYSLSGVSFQLILISVSTLYIASMHALVRYGYYNLSVILYNLFFALSFAGIICSLSGEIGHIASGFFVLILVATLFVKNKGTSLFLIGVNLVLLLGSIYYSRNYLPFLGLTQNPTVEIIIYFTSAVNIAVIGYALIMQIRISEDQIQSLIGSLQQQNVELNNTNKELEKITYLATHDLKSPVRSMISFLGLIKRELSSTNMENANTYCNFALDGATQMNDLIKATLSYSQINCGTDIPKEDVDPNAIIAKIENVAKQSNKDVVIKYANLPIIATCGTMLYKLLQNLIENGIKYNKSNIKVIRIDAKVSDNNYHLSVTDNGIGIEPKFHEEVFEMYTRLHNNREYDGTGLGLAICRRICHQIGGEIAIDPMVTEGTRFIITIPLEAAAQVLVA